jgi:SOS-response transcriptional repressor LexA
MQKRGITRGGLSRATGIPYTTIVGFYDKGYENIKLSNAKKLAEYFGVSLEYLCCEDHDQEHDLRPENENSSSFGKKYAMLNSESREIVDGVIDGLLRICGSSTPETTETIYIREYLTPAAAGYASPAMGEDYVLIPKDSNVPREADFAVKISGDSMEPYIADGSRVYVKRTNELDDGDVGVFFVNGDMKCKQYCEDNFGNIYLLSLNRERSDADTVVSASSGVTVFCFGKVLLQKRPPLPGV